MAYKLDEIKAASLNAIEKQKLVFIDEIPTYIPCGRSTFYDMKLNHDKDILAAINANKVKMKGGMRLKWYKSEQSGLQIALYKLLADETELSRLSHQAVDLTSKGRELKRQTVDVSKLDTKTLLALKKAGELDSPADTEQD